MARFQKLPFRLVWRQVKCIFFGVDEPIYLEQSEIKLIQVVYFVISPAFKTYELTFSIEILRFREFHNKSKLKVLFNNG